MQGLGTYLVRRYPGESDSWRCHWGHWHYKVCWGWNYVTKHL